MPLRPSELGDGRMHVDLRTGVAGIDKWKGVVREGDPAAIPDESLWYAENTRLVGGKILSRGGQTAVNGTAGSGCIDGFFDAGDMGAQNPGAYVETTLYFANDSNLNFSQISTASVVTETVAEDVLSNPTLYSDRVYFSSVLGGGSYAVKSIAAGGTVSATSFSITQLSVGDIGPTGPCVFNDKLWIVYLYGGANTAGKVYSWDGVTAVEEHAFTQAQTGGAVLGLNGLGTVSEPFLGGFVSVGLDGDCGAVLYRDSSGTLTFPALPDFVASPADTLTQVRGRMSVLGSNLYIPCLIGGASTTYKINAFNGTSISNVHTVTGATAIFSTAILGGYLYYAYQLTSNSVRLGRTADGSTWTDNYATVGAISGDVSDLVAHNGSLYVLAGTGTGQGIWKSSGADTTTWTRVYSATGATGIAASVQA